MLSVPAIRRGLIEGRGFLGGDRWLSTIAEFKPYFNDPPTRWLDAESTFWWRAYFGGERAAVAGIAEPKPVRGFRLVWTDEMDVGYAFGLRGDAAQIWAVE